MLNLWDTLHGPFAGFFLVIDHFFRRRSDASSIRYFVVDFQISINQISNFPKMSWHYWQLKMRLWEWSRRHTSDKHSLRLNVKCLMDYWTLLEWKTLPLMATLKVMVYNGMKQTQKFQIACFEPINLIPDNFFPHGILPCCLPQMNLREYCRMNNTVTQLL